MILHMLVRGRPESLEMLGSILAAGERSPFVPHEVGGHLSVDVDSPEEIWGAVAKVQGALDLAAGAMRIWTNSRDHPKVTNLNYRDPKTGKERGLLLNAYSIIERLKPEELAEPTPRGVPRGTAVLDLAFRDVAVAKALSVSASGATEWWELYILLEVLRDSIGRRAGRRTGSWENLFQVLASRYGKSAKRLEDLKRTINYYRHAASVLPRNPWDHQEALVFVRTAIRDWLDQCMACGACDLPANQASGAAAPARAAHRHDRCAPPRD